MAWSILLERSLVIMGCPLTLISYTLGEHWRNRVILALG
jgi:hypothetical protein